MFKKVFQTLSRTFSGRENPKPASASAKGGSLLDKINPPAAAAAAAKTKAEAPPASAKPKSADELCAITPKMSKDEIRAQLALLYRRYNRATSSLDAKLRAEAETMLDAIVVIREKTFGPI